MFLHTTNAHSHIIVKGGAYLAQANLHTSTDINRHTQTPTLA